MDEHEYRREEEERVERSVRRLFSSGAQVRRTDEGSGLAGVPVPNPPAPWQDEAHALLPALAAEDDQASLLPGHGQPDR